MDVVGIDRKLLANNVLVNCPDQQNNYQTFLIQL